MPPIYFLIKPASGNCNMRCKYCFYHDVAENRAVASYGIMSKQTLEQLVKTAMEQAEGSCGFMFQGGEPTLAGLDFFREAVRLQKEYNKKGLQVFNSIQTNGYCIDREWAQFLAKEKFLVGLSLDGMKEIHDGCRVDAQGKGTFSKVMHAAQLFSAYGVEFNILTVVTAYTARNIGKIYGFFKKNGFVYQQYIPCLDPFGQERGTFDYSLTPERYGDFLIKLFDLWYTDFMRGKYISIRWFDALVHMCKGRAPGSCGMLGVCTPQLVVEADGGVYPCDFYVLDKLRLGTVGVDTPAQWEEKRKTLGFIEQSKKVEPECRACRWAPLCRGGCRRDREQADGSIGLNYLCPAFQRFFAHAAPRLAEIAKRVP